MSVRRRTIAWATPSDDGDAAVALDEIARWRRTLAPVPDLEPTILAIRDRLTLLCISPLVRADAECRTILLDMIRCRDMEQLNAEMTRLGARIDAILAARVPARPASAAPSRAMPDARTGRPALDAERPARRRIFSL